MRMIITAAIVLSVAGVAAAQRGVVSSVRVTATETDGTMLVTVRGSNPCSAVRVDFGDGTAATYPIRALPITILHDYSRTGPFAVSAEGSGDCGGAARTAVMVGSVRPGQQAPTPAVTAQASSRFGPMDRNNDGRIDRGEWRGSARSFDLHDWNRDGVLSGDEVRVGAARPRSAGGDPARFDDWTQARFVTLDTNRDGRLTRAEWPYDLEGFLRVDRNGDNALVLNEFLIGDVDEDRNDRFDDLDANRDNRIDRSEWHGSDAAFQWLDRNRNGVLTRVEAAGVSDVAANPRPTGVPDNPRPVAVSSRQAWTDTRIELRAGDIMEIQATGQIFYAPGSGDEAAPDGSPGQRATDNAPIPQSNIGALIGRIGDGEPFVIGGSTDSIPAPRAGRLYLGVNDDVLTDNRGNFIANITIWRR